MLHKLDGKAEMTIINGLRVAARAYDDSAKAMEEMTGLDKSGKAARVRLVEQFNRQATDARKLADQMEEGETEVNEETTS